MRMRSTTAALLAVTLTVSTLGLPTAAVAATYIPVTPAQEIASDGYAASSVADAGGRLHIVFQRYSQPGLWYATNPGGVWTMVKIAVTQGTPQLAIDGSGRVYAVQTDEGASPGVHLTTNRSGSWTTVRLTSESTDRFPSIAVDSLGEVHIAFGEASLVYLTNRLGYWVRRTIASSGAHPSIALDANRRVHIAYESSGGIKHVTDANGVSWVTGTVNATGSRPSLSIRGSAMAIAFGRAASGSTWLRRVRLAGRPAASAPRSCNGTPAHRCGLTRLARPTSPTSNTHRAAPHWSTTPQTYRAHGPSRPSARAGRRPHPGSRRSDRPHVLHDGALSPLVERIDVAGRVHRRVPHDLQPDIATGADGLARIVYATPFATPGLRAGTWDGTGFGQTRITQSEDREPAIAVDPSGASHVAFVRTGAPTTLWYGTNAGGPWAFEQIASDDNFGCPDIGIGQDGHVHVAAQRTHVDAGFIFYRPVWYTDATGSWVVRDDLPIVTGTGCPAIAVDAQDEPHLIYSEANGVYITQLVSGDWSHTKFGDGTLRAGRIVLTDDGSTYASYARRTTTTRPSVGYGCGRTRQDRGPRSASARPPTRTRVMVWPWMRPVTFMWRTAASSGIRDSTTRRTRAERGCRCSCVIRT